jgi:hypothetical protein
MRADRIVPRIAGSLAWKMGYVVAAAAVGMDAALGLALCDAHADDRQIHRPTDS